MAAVVMAAAAAAAVAAAVVGRRRLHSTMALSEPLPAQKFDSALLANSIKPFMLKAVSRQC